MITMLMIILAGYPIMGVLITVHDRLFGPVNEGDHDA